MTALGLYELRINGQRVGQNILAPEWTDYQTRIQYQTYDVTDLLHEGENVICAILGEGWYAGRMGLYGSIRTYGDHLGLLAQLEAKFADGKRYTVVTDSSWKGTLEGPVRGSDIIFGEIYDARREIPGWDRAGFDDSTWQPVEVLPKPKVRLVAQPNEPIRVMEELAPVSVKEPTPGVVVYDLGQNMVGWCSIRARGPAGTVVKLRHAEVLNPDGTAYTENLRGPFQVNEFILQGEGVEEYTPRFTYHGFRYLEVSGLPTAGSGSLPSADDVTGHVFYSASPAAGTFECSSPMLNQLMKNIVWTQRGNMHSTPTDCPQRDERMGWMGDAQIFSQAACFNMNMAGFFTKWLQDVRDGQTEQGQYSDFSPNPRARKGEFVAAPAWADAGLIVPWRVYENYADKRLLERHYESAKRWVDYVQRNSTDFIWTDGRGNDYGDWLNGDTLILEDWPKKGADLSREQLATVFAAHSVDMLTRMARVLGHAGDARKYKRLFEDIKKAYDARYVGEDARNVEDNQTAYALALHFNLLPEEKRAASIEHLLRKIDDYNGHISTGIQATNRMMLELAGSGHTDVAYRLLTNRTIPSWGYMVDNGATTVWERWDGWVDGRGFQNAGMNSFNHYAIGAVAEWMYRCIAGINPDPAGPGFKRIAIHPRPGGGLSWAKATHDCIHGRIATHWQLEGERFTLDVTIPANTRATVVLPARESGHIAESGKPLSQAEGIEVLQTGEGRVDCEVSSGKYRFIVSPHAIDTDQP